MDYHEQLRGSPCEIDRLRLKQIDRCFQSWRVDTATREMLAVYRGRARTMWSAEEKEVNKAHFGRNLKALQDDGLD